MATLPENGGAGEARNAGWDSALGDYVAFLDADDAWHPRKIELQHRFMTEHPEFALCGHRHSIMLSGSPAQVELEKGYERVSAKALLVANRVVTPSVMLRREIPPRFPPGKRYMEDHYLWTRMAFEGSGVARMNAALATTYKRTFGDSRPSSNLVSMELGGLDNYRRLRREGRIGWPTCVALCALSVARLARRWLLTVWRRAWKQDR